MTRRRHVSPESISILAPAAMVTIATIVPMNRGRSRLTGGVNRFGRRFPRRSGKSEEGAYVRVEEGIACRAAARTER